MLKPLFAPRNGPGSQSRYNLGLAAAIGFDFRVGFKVGVAVEF
jgi:hypothetical protein